MRKLIMLFVAASFFVFTCNAWTQEGDDQQKKEEQAEPSKEPDGEAAARLAAAQENYYNRYNQLQSFNEILPGDITRSLEYWALLADKTDIWSTAEIEEFDRTAVLFKILKKYGEKTAEIFTGSEGGRSDGWQNEEEAVRAFTDSVYLARLDRYIETIRQLAEAVKQGVEKLSVKFPKSPRIEAWEKEAEQKFQESMKLTDANPNQKPDDKDAKSGDESKKEEKK